MPIWHFATFRNIFQNAVKSRHVFLIQLDPHKDKYYTFWDPNFAFDNELFHNFFRFQLLNCKRRQQVSASFSCKLLFSSFSFGEKASQSYFTPSLLLSLWCSLFAGNHSSGQNEIQSTTTWGSRLKPKLKSGLQKSPALETKVWCSCNQPQLKLPAQPYHSWWANILSEIFEEPPKTKPLKLFQFFLSCQS